MFNIGNKKQSKEARKRQEHLMYLAKEKPDKIYDLSACEMSKIPQGVYSMCKVLQKESLLLHTNLLKSVKTQEKLSDLSNLRILDLHCNKILKLPEEIKFLKNLQILNVENNKLTTFPLELGELKNLQTLNAKDNLLNCLPKTIGGMSSLRTVDISGTNKVFYLPKALAQVRTLEVLLLSNVTDMEYPASFICKKGLEEMKKFICKDTGLEYMPPSHKLLNVLSADTKSNSMEEEDSSFQDKIMDYERLKEEKRKQQLLVEKEIAESQMKEAHLAAQNKHARTKDTSAIIEENEKFEKLFNSQQEESNFNRKRMLKLLTEAENTATALIEKLLKDSEKAAQTERLVQEMERQRMEEEEYFRVTQDDLDNLRKKETVAAMNTMLQDDEQTLHLVNKYLVERNETIARTQGTLIDEEHFMNNIIAQQNAYKQNLVHDILEEEELQLVAFQALQFSLDETRQRILSQIKDIEKELANLTSVETARKKLKMDLEQEIFSNERQQLTDLLTVLLKQKDHREEDLKKMMGEMEQQRENDQIDFWLVQYQRLLDSKPQVLLERQSNMDMEVIKLLTQAGAEHHTASFARHKIININLLAQLDDAELQHIGVFEIGLRKNILRLIEESIMPRLKKLAGDNPKEILKPVPLQHLDNIMPETSQPSQPMKPEQVDSVENECVICLDKQSNCVLLPCGHVCACNNCVDPLLQCPMCRKDIQQKIRLYRS